MTSAEQEVKKRRDFLATHWLFTCYFLDAGEASTINGLQDMLKNPRTDSWIWAYIKDKN